ncbi:hypothetical protein V5N11_032845 [Cardamine amara subsp. amara]|uniref:DUF3741 domain-containing protein n=1 Tax=Cardamine amara subsp. amara TaxID=228776 RepID=A0ABD0Z785_CARAN
MPEGKLRSGVYRSFIMCDDPRDVVECGAIKKRSKNRSITNQRCDHSSKSKDRFEIAVAPPRKSIEDAPPPPPSSSSMQLLRVSKGIQKLNVAIESWSKGCRFKAEDIAKDLLRGALDLEESLAMLSSIQEEDDDINKKQRICKDGRSDLRFQRSMSDRFGERIEKRMMIQENVASKDCYDDLRKVVRESFLRQNLLPQTEIKTRVVRNGFASSSGAASSSTSSSQSSLVSGSTKSSASSDVPRRAPSLIARLMGLDVGTQEPSKSTVNHIDKSDIVKLSLEREEQMMKNKKKESSETVLQSLPKEIQSENPSTIVLIRPMRVVQPVMEEKPGNKRPVLPKKPRMQGEVHPRMINQRKEHQAKSSNKMKVPISVTKKDKEPKETARKVEENEGKVIKLMTPSNGKAVTRDRKPMETKKKVVVKKENIAEGKDRHRPQDRALKPPNNPTTHKKLNSSSNNSRNKNQRSSRLSSSTSSGEQKSSRENKTGETSKPNAKKKLHQQDNEHTSENNSASSQNTHGSINQLSSEETTSSEFHILQGHCDNGEVSSSAVTIQHSHEPETSQISLKSFLSTSSDFISYVEDLFDLKTNTKRNQESAFQNRDSIVISDQRLALDFAKEVARRRSLLLLAEPTCPQRSCLHIDELLMEVCDEYEFLRSYRDTFLGQNSFVKESIHIDMVLEKDLKGKKTEMRSSVWDLAWRSEFQIDETHQAVVDLENLILSGLIQEIIS